MQSLARGSQSGSFDVLKQPNDPDNYIITLPNIQKLELLEENTVRYFVYAMKYYLLIKACTIHN